jgi:chemosensory pili system protein ChpE
MEFLSGLMLGTAYVAAPGPIGVETLRYGLRGGFRAAIAVQAGSALGLLFYAALALAGVGTLFQRALWQSLFNLGGMALLVTLGLATIRDGRRLGIAGVAAGAGHHPSRGALRTGALLSLANPLDLLFWLSIGSGVLRQPPQQGLLFLSALAAGCLLASLLLALFAAFCQSRLTGRALQTVFWFCGLALVVFGLQLGLATIAFEQM